MKRLRASDSSLTTIVYLNVGGKAFDTTIGVLTQAFPDSLIAQMFLAREDLRQDETGRCFIDADPILFGHILQLLRRPSLIETVPQGVQREVWETELEHWRLYPPYVLTEERIKYRRWLNEAQAEREALDRAVLTKLVSFVEIEKLPTEDEIVQRMKPIVTGMYHIGDEELVEYVTQHDTHFINLLNNIFTHHEIDFCYSPFGCISKEEKEKILSYYPELSSSHNATRVLCIEATYSCDEESHPFLKV